jgi:uncharacterized protein
MANLNPIPHLGFGLGLRIPHYAHILEHRPKVGFFEIISENFMNTAGIPLYNLDRVKETYPLVMHGVCMSLGSPGPLDTDYMQRLKQLARRIGAPWFSDHLCWSRGSGHHVGLSSRGAHQFHDLLPMPYTSGAARHVAEKARQAQDFLEIPFGIENLSAIVEFKSGTMPEWEFYREVIELSGCHMMLDINNVYVSSRNHGFNADEYIDGLELKPGGKVLQMHLAGHTDHGSYVLDTHDHPVRDEVWKLYAKAYRLCGGASTLIEWDDRIPSFEETFAEAAKAEAIVTTSCDIDHILQPPKPLHSL